MNAQNKMAMILVATGAMLGECHGTINEFPDPPEEYLPFAEVLDGDTIVVDGKAINIRGVDAAELGPWAECWAEAALGGEAREFMQRQMYEEDWRLANVEESENGNAIADVISDSGADLADSMVIYGHAAKTEEPWDWCGTSVPLESVREGTPPPHGPNLWWPANQMFDERAGQ